MRRVNGCDGVQAGLLADGEQNCRNAVEQRGGVLVFHAVFHMPDIGDANKRAALFSDHDVVEILRDFSTRPCVRSVSSRVF